MTNKVYPLGYSRHGTLIDQLMQDDKTLLIDTRYSPNSRISQWVGTALKRKYGERYRWAGKYLGNPAKGTGRLEVAQPVKGIAGLIQYLQESYDLILLCGCAEYTKCHRSLIIQLLQGALPSVEVVMPEQIVKEK